MKMTSSLPEICERHSPALPKTLSLSMTSSLPAIAAAESSRVARRRRRRRLGARPLASVEAAGVVGEGGNGLVDIPRLVMTERTFVVTDTHLAIHLERFYNIVTHVDPSKVAAVKDRADALLRHLLPRVAKLGVRVGLRLIGTVKTGSVYDRTCVVSVDEVDVLVMFDSYQVSTVMSPPGYVTILLDSAERGKDHWRFGRSRDKAYLSPITVSRTLHSLVHRVLRSHSNYWKILPFDMDASRSPVAACAVSHLPDDVTYVVARPYMYDLDTGSDTLWRLSTVERESRILDQMDRSDRGTRRKAFRVLKALVLVEPTLAGLSSYHVRTAVLHAFDSVVDGTPLWQRHTVAAAFIQLLTELADRLTDRRLPHFFFRRYDLLAAVSPQVVARWRDRLRFLATHDRELERVLRRRADELAAIRDARSTAIAAAAASQQ